MKIIENNIERDATLDEEEFFQEQLGTIIQLPKPLTNQIDELKQQQLDIAEAVVSLYETIALGVEG